MEPARSSHHLQWRSRKRAAWLNLLVPPSGRLSPPRHAEPRAGDSHHGSAGAAGARPHQRRGSRPLGLTLEDVEDDDWTVCQAVGEAAHFLALAGVAAPSASGVGLVVAAFEDRVKAGHLAHHVTISLDEATYERSSQ